MGTGNRGDIRTRLQEWLIAQRHECRSLTVSELTAPGAGASNETLLFEVEWQQNGKKHCQALVLRLEPKGPGLFPDYDLSKQYKAMDLLSGTTVPVPELVGFEADPAVLGTPFFLMERINGRMATENPPYHMEGWVKDLTPEQRGELWRNSIRTMARINRLDWQALGFDYLDNPALGDSPLSQQLNYYRNFLSWVENRGRPYPKLQAALEWLETKRPKEESVALCWGDPKIANLLYEGTNVVGVLDWEMAHIGDPVDDLAFWLTVDNVLSDGLELLLGEKVPKLSGIPDRKGTIALWEEEGGHSAKQLDYYELFCALKYGVILASVGINMTNDGIVPREMEMDINNPSKLILDRLMLKNGIEFQ